MTDHPYTPLPTDDPTEFVEPYQFSTILQLKPGGDRHKLLTAVVHHETAKCGDGYRYNCLFPVPTGSVRVSKVYSDEIESVTGMDTNGEILCSGCADEIRNRCFAQGITPAVCF